MRIESEDIIIESNVDKGIYYFDDDSAIGKSRLCQLIEILRKRDIKVDCYSYDSYCNKSRLPDHNDGLILFVVDRYDMYSGAINDTILDVGNSTLVIIDTKTYSTGLGKVFVGDIEVTMESPTKIKLEDIFI